MRTRDEWVGGVGRVWRGGGFAGYACIVVSVKNKFFVSHPAFPVSVVSQGAKPHTRERKCTSALQCRAVRDRGRFRPLSVCVCVCVFEWLWTPTHGFHVQQTSYVGNVVFSPLLPSPLFFSSADFVAGGFSRSGRELDTATVGEHHSLGISVCVCTHSSGHSVIQAFARICRQQCNTDCYLLWSSALLAMGQREVIPWWCPGLDH